MNIVKIAKYLKANKDIDTVYNTALNYFKKKFSISGNVKIQYSGSKSSGGYVDILEILNDKLTIHIHKDFSLPIGIGILIHELTHVSQVLKGKLKQSDETIMWENKPYITFKNYNKLIKNDFAKYSVLPWEKEAFYNYKNLPAEFFQSEEFAALANINDTLNFIVSNYNKHIPVLSKTVITRIIDVNNETGVAFLKKFKEAKWDVKLVSRTEVSVSKIENKFTNKDKQLLVDFDKL